MLHNVSVVTDVASPYKGLRSKTMASKLWRSEVWEWRSHDLAERIPIRRQAAKAFTILLKLSNK